MTNDPDSVREAEFDLRPAEGISIERRALLWLPLAVAGGVVLHGAPLFADDKASALETAAGENAFARLSREELGARWVALAQALRLAPKEADESYAAQLAGLVSRVPLELLPRLENGREKDGVAGGPTWFVAPCVTIEFRMQPGAVLKLHNHPPQVVMTLGVEGEARYRHFELEGDAPPCTQIDGKEFRVRETRSGVLAPHRSTSLTRARDGMHGFEAGKDGARIIDFTLSLTDDIETFSYVDLSPEPLDRERCVYGATWLGKSR